MPADMKNVYLREFYRIGLCKIRQKQGELFYCTAAGASLAAGRTARRETSRWLEVVVDLSDDHMSYYAGGPLAPPSSSMQGTTTLALLYTVPAILHGIAATMRKISSLVSRHRASPHIFASAPQENVATLLYCASRENMGFFTANGDELFLFQSRPVPALVPALHPAVYSRHCTLHSARTQQHSSVREVHNGTPAIEPHASCKRGHLLAQPK